MSKFKQLIQCLSLIVFSQLFHVSQGAVGTASHYDPHYRATACFGNDVSQFPSSNMFAAAGEAIWDNGAACARKYLVRCISAVVATTCTPGQTIQIRIVDRAQSSTSRPSRGTTMDLSTTAFGTIANASASSINIEFQQV